MLRFATVTFLALCLLGGHANAQQVVSLDPSAVAYSPRLLSLRGCGFAIGVDPSWSHKVSGGGGETKHTFASEGQIPGAIGTFVDEFTGPRLDMTITCEQSEPTSDKGRTAYNRTLADGMRSSYAAGGASSVSSVKRASFGPFRNGYQFEWTTASNHDRFGTLTATNGNVFAHVGDTRVTIFYRQGGYAGPRNAKKIPAGTVIQASRATQVKITSPLVMMDSGAMFPVRSLAMERRFMTTVLGTIQ